MLPLLMMMSGNKGNKNGGTRTHHAPTTPNLNQPQGMLSPEMLKILSDLGSC